MNTFFRKALESVRVIFIIIGGFAALALGGYWYVHQNLVTDPTSKPTCSVATESMVGLINQYRAQHKLAEVIESKSLDNIAKDISDMDSQDNSMTLSSSRITDATTKESYTSATLTYQVFPSTDSTVNGYIFKEMTNSDSYKNALLDATTGQVGIFTNCSVTSRTITVHANDPSQANINGQQYKVNSLTYMVYDH